MSAFPAENASDGDAGFEIRDTKDVAPEAILELFRQVDWARERTRESVVVALARTTVLITGWRAGRCVAMLRALSDGVYRAMIEDVIVHPDFRGRGYGRRLLEVALAHPFLRDVDGVFLITEVPAFYEKFDFRRVESGMVRLRAGAGRGGA